MDAFRIRLLPVVIFLCCFAEARSQVSKASALQQRIVLSKTPIRLDSLLKKISQQTSLIFSYNARKVNRHLLLAFPSGSSTVEDLLKAIKEKTGLDYALAENHIILKQPKSSPPPVSANQTHSNKEEQQPLKKSGFIPLPEPVATKKDSSITVTSQTDSSQKEVSYAAKISAKENTTPTVNANNTITSGTAEEKVPVKPDTVKSPLTPQKETARAPQPTVKKSPPPFQLKAGLSADETLYLGPAMQLGVPWLYGTVAYKTDFTIGVLTYGAGTSVKLNDQWRLNLFCLWGDASKSSTFSFRSELDSSKTVDTVYRVKSKLTRLGLALEKKIKGNFSIQFGLQYNVLTSAYTINDIPAENVTHLSDVKNLQAFPPPYSFSSGLNTRDWVGIHLSVFYTLRFSKPQ